MKQDLYEKEIILMPHLAKALEEHGIKTLHDLNKRVRGLAFLQGIKTDVQRVCARFREDYTAFYAMCVRKSAAKGKNNPDGTVLSFLANDVENACLMGMM